MKSRRNQRRHLRKTRKVRNSNLRRKSLRKLTKGGSLTAIPTGAVDNMRLDPKDAYSIPVTVNKDTAEKIIDEATF